MTVITAEELGPDLADRLGRLGGRPSRDDVLDRIPMPLPRPMPRRDMPDMPRRGGGDKIDLSKLLDRLMGQSPKREMPMPPPILDRSGDLPAPRSRRRDRPRLPGKPMKEGFFKGGNKKSPKEMMDMLRDKLSGGIPRPRGQSYEDVVARGGGGINPVVGPNGERLFDLMESGGLKSDSDRPSMPMMPGKVMRMNEGGEAMSPLEILYGQIGVADESGARDVIEKILSGRSSELTEDQRALTNSGIYRRVANRLGILDRAGNPISAGSSVATDAGRTYTPTIGRALQTLSEMEGAESGSGIESLLKQILGYNPNEEATGGAYRQAIEASGFPGFMAGVGGEEGGQPMPEQPNKGYAGYGGQGTSYGGNYGNPEYKGYFGEAPAMPYAGMSSPNPSLSNIIGMAPANYFGMADVVGKEDEGGTAS